MHSVATALLAHTRHVPQRAGGAVLAAPPVGHHCVVLHAREQSSAWCPRGHVRHTIAPGGDPAGGAAMLSHRARWHGPHDTGASCAGRPA